MGLAFWIKDGKIKDVSGSHHIYDVDMHPEDFGLTMKYVKAVHKKHKEKMFSEGDAREEIVKELAKTGWMRVRKYESRMVGEYWSIQFGNYRQSKKQIQEFVYWALVKKKIMKKTDMLVLVGFNDGTVEKINASLFLRESKNKQSNLKELIEKFINIYEV